MRDPEALKSVKIPENVELKVKGRVVEVKGEKGILSRDFSQAPVSIQAKEGEVRVKANWPRKREASSFFSKHIKQTRTSVRSSLFGSGSSATGVLLFTT